MSSFLGNLKSAAASAVTGGDDDKKNTESDQTPKSDLMSSAKLVAESAQCAANNQSDKIDKAKTAGAAADLLDAAKTYGKFDETQGVGQYLKKADDYLHEYEKSGSAAPPPAKEEGAPPVAAPEEKKEKEKKEEKKEEFGAADALKAAGSFFK
ncbi:nodulin-related protein 1-like protein [Tanacetum coccineum]